MSIFWGEAPLMIQPERTLFITTLCLTLLLVPMKSSGAVVTPDESRRIQRISDTNEQVVTPTVSMIEKPVSTPVTLMTEMTFPAKKNGPWHVTEERTLFPFPFDDISDVVGRVHLTLDYMSGDHNWMSLDTDLTIGWLNVALTDIQPGESPDTIRVHMTLASDGPVNDIPVLFTASFRHTQPDPSSRRLKLHVDDYNVPLYQGAVFLQDGTPEMITIDVPLPGTSEAGLWEIAVHAETTSTMSIRAERMHRIFSIK